MSAQEFLDLYKQMEALLDEKYGESAGRRGNAVTRFINEPAGREYRDELDLCREVRNLLTHNPEMGGHPVVEPAPALLQTLREAIERLEAPPTVMQFATPVSNLMVTDFSQCTLSVMEAMERRGFSHIPILLNQQIRGVFSVSTLFSYMLEYPNQVLDLSTSKVSDFREFTSIYNHTCERFMFMTPKHTYWDAQKAFENESSPQQKRLVAIFITTTGDERGQLMGMLTPWDIIGQEESPYEDSGRNHRKK